MLPLDLTARFSTHVSFGNWCIVSAMSLLCTGKDSAMAAALMMRMRLAIEFIAKKVLERSKLKSWRVQVALSYCWGLP